MKKKELMAKANVSKTTMDQMWRKKYVALSVLDRICTALDCEIQDVIKHKKETEDIKEAEQKWVEKSV